jgi:short-subunit dehydrogenase
MSDKLNVFITGITGALGSSLQKKSLSHGLNTYGQSTHLSNSEIVQNDFSKLDFDVFEDFFQKHEINCLINNAAIYSDTPLMSLTDDSIINMVNTNLIAPILLTKYFYSNLINRKKFGILVNINSLAGKYPNFNESIYCSTKYGLSGFGNSMSINQKQSNILVLNCYLGAMKTSMTKHRFDFDNLMDTDSIAEFIFDNILNNKNHFISSVEIRNI